MVLILVAAHSAVYLKSDRPQPAVLFEVVRGIVTGQPPRTGDLRYVDGDELHPGRR